MLEASSIATLMATSYTKNPKDEENVDSTQYRSIVGSLQYLTLTRPDIPYSVNKVCQHMQEPKMKILSEVKRILRYILNTEFIIALLFLKIVH